MYRTLEIIVEMFNEYNLFDKVVDKVYINWTGKPHIRLKNGTIIRGTYKDAYRLVRLYK